MNRYFCLYSLVFVCFCSFADIEQRQINVLQGEAIEIVLPSNMSTSYAWRAYQYNAKDITHITSNYVPSGTQIGGGGYSHWKISLAAGVSSTSIHFVYMPSYIETVNIADYDQVIYNIDVIPLSHGMN